MIDFYCWAPLTPLAATQTTCSYCYYLLNGLGLAFAIIGAFITCLHCKGLFHCLQRSSFTMRVSAVRRGAESTHIDFSSFNLIVDYGFLILDELAGSEQPKEAMTTLHYSLWTMNDSFTWIWALLGWWQPHWFSLRRHCCHWPTPPQTRLDWSVCR